MLVIVQLALVFSSVHHWYFDAWVLIGVIDLDIVDVPCQCMSQERKARKRERVTDGSFSSSKIELENRYEALMPRCDSRAKELKGYI